MVVGGGVNVVDVGIPGRALVVAPYFVCNRIEGLGADSYDIGMS